MVSFSDAVQRAFQQYFTFRGRSTRAEYWWFFLFLIIGEVLLSLVDIMMGTYSVESGSGFGSGLFVSLFTLGTLIPRLALGARRLHDINRTGWWQLMWLSVVLAVRAISFELFWFALILVVVPAIILMVWAAKQGDDGPNKYG